jgi:hypothetical protein
LRGEHATHPVNIAPPIALPLLPTTTMSSQVLDILNGYHHPPHPTDAIS